MSFLLHEKTTLYAGNNLWAMRNEVCEEEPTLIEYSHWVMQFDTRTDGNDRYYESWPPGILYRIVPLRIHSELPSVSIGADFEPVHRRDVMSVIDLENCSVKHYLSLEDALSENNPVERVSLTDGHALVYARINFAHVGLPEKEGGYDLDIGQGIRVKYWIEE